MENGIISSANDQGRHKLKERLDKARTEIHGKGYKLCQPQNGSYLYCYHQNGKYLSGKCYLFFLVKDGKGFVITGTFNDPDGLTNIYKGFCTHNGKAYWKESYVSGDTGLEVLNKGELDFKDHL